MSANRRFGRAGSGERGMALVSALLLLVVMSGLAIALAASGRIEVAMGDNEELYAGARAAAESGLNHAAAVILQQTSQPTFAIDGLLRGPDNAADPDNPGAQVNADNGTLAHLIGGTAPWPVVAGSAFAYDVRVLDDDDPEMKGEPFTLAELTAMGPPPGPAENGNRFNDVNRRVVIRATGIGPRGTRAVLEQSLMPVRMPALLVNGDLFVGGYAELTGNQGSVHANGNLTILGSHVKVEKSATATGLIEANESWHPGELGSGGMPEIPSPDIRAIDYLIDAEYVLKSDGRITSRDGNTEYCNASSVGTACRDITPPGGSGPFGWSYSAVAGWDLSGPGANAATYYAQHNASISGNPGTPGMPLRMTLIAEGNIIISGSPVLEPHAASELLLLTNQDLDISGNAATPPTLEGRILVREQIELTGTMLLAGPIIVQSASALSALVDANFVSGYVRLFYDGLIETLVYTVSGWRELP